MELEPCISHVMRQEFEHQHVHNVPLKRVLQTWTQARRNVSEVFSLTRSTPGDHCDRGPLDGIQDRSTL